MVWHYITEFQNLMVANGQLTLITDGVVIIILIQLP